MTVSSAPPAGGSCDCGHDIGPRKRLQDFQTLARALSSGDLAGAQQAFANLQKDGPNAADGTHRRHRHPGKDSPLGKDFEALQTALASGNIADAETAFDTLQKDLQSLREAHHNHDPDKDGEADAAAQGAAGTTISSLAGGSLNELA